MKQIFVSAGNKGGVGKSTIASAAADYFIDRLVRLAVVETDSTQPDVRNRYQGVENIIVGELDLGGDAEGAMVRLGSWIESKSADIDAIVINAPAGGGAVLDPFATILAEVAAALDFQLCVAWVIGATVEDTNSVHRSLAGGLLSIPCARRNVCLAGWMGDPGQWPWVRSPVRAAALEAGIEERVVPALTQHVNAQVVDRHSTPLAALCLPVGGLSIAVRSSLSRWRRAMHQLVSSMLIPAEAGNAE